MSDILCRCQAIVGVVLALIVAAGCASDDDRLSSQAVDVTHIQKPVGEGDSFEVRTLTSEGLLGPSAVVVAEDGTVFIADFDAAAILRLTADGVLTTLAGGNGEGLEDGRGSDAMFRGPAAIVIGPDGALYVSDAPNHRIRRVDLDGNVTTVAGSGGYGLGAGGFQDGMAVRAQFDVPAGLAFDSEHNLIIADKNNHAVRMLSPDGLVSTVVRGEEGYEDGPIERAKLSFPVGLAITDAGALFITEHGNNAVRLLDQNSVGTLRISSPPDYRGTPAQAGGLAFPSGIAVSNDGLIYVADVQNHRIIAMDSTGEVRIVVGSQAGFVDSRDGDARFRSPTDVAVSPSGSLIVADRGNGAIREVER